MRIFITGRALKQRIQQLEKEGYVIQLFDDGHKSLHISNLNNNFPYPLENIKFTVKGETL